MIPKFLENSVRPTNLTMYMYGTGEEGLVGSGHQQRDRELWHSKTTLARGISQNHHKSEGFGQAVGMGVCDIWAKG